MNTRLLYNQPAKSFQDAMPIGSARLGAMLFSRPLRCEDYYSERVVLNEESLWYGGPTRRENPNSAKSIAEIRQLLLEGRIKDAEYLADTNLAAAPRNGSPYQSLGELVSTSRREHDPVKKLPLRT